MWFHQEHAMFHVLSVVSLDWQYGNSDMTKFCNLLPLLFTFPSRYYFVQLIWYLVGVLNGCNMLRQQVEMRVVAAKVTEKEVLKPPLLFQHWQSHMAETILEELSSRVKLPHWLLTLITARLAVKLFGCLCLNLHWRCTLVPLLIRSLVKAN